jgi:WD40 repeat protein
MWRGSVSRGGVVLLAFAPDSRTLYTRSAADLTAWDLRTCQPTKIGQAKWYATTGALAPAPDGRHLVVTHANNLDVFDVPERRKISSQELNLWGIFDPVFINGGADLLTIDCTHNAEYILTRRTWPALQSVPLLDDVPKGKLFSLRTSPLGDRILGILQDEAGRHVAVFAAGFPNSAASVRIITPGIVAEWHPTLSPDGDIVALAHNGRVACFDVASGTCRFDVRISRSDINQIAMHPNGRLLAAGGNDGTVRLLDPYTGNVHKEFDWGIGKVRSVAFSPDGCLGAAGGQKSLAVWDVD